MIAALVIVLLLLVFGGGLLWLFGMMWAVFPSKKTVAQARARLARQAEEALALQAAEREDQIQVALEVQRRLAAE